MVFGKTWRRCKDCFIQPRSPVSLEALPPHNSPHRSSPTSISVSRRSDESARTRSGPSSGSREKVTAEAVSFAEEIEIEWPKRDDSMTSSQRPTRPSAFRGSHFTGEASTSASTSDTAQPLVTRGNSPPSAPSPLALASLELCRGAYKNTHKGEVPKRAIFKDPRAKWQNKTYLSILADVTEEASQSSSTGKGSITLQGSGSNNTEQRDS